MLGIMRKSTVWKQGAFSWLLLRKKCSSISLNSKRKFRMLAWWWLIHRVRACIQMWSSIWQIWSSSMRLSCSIFRVIRSRWRKILSYWWRKALVLSRCKGWICFHTLIILNVFPCWGRKFLLYNFFNDSIEIISHFFCSFRNSFLVSYSISIIKIFNNISYHLIFRFLIMFHFFNKGIITRWWI